MLVVFIATAVLLAVLYALLKSGYKKRDRSVYEVSTGPSKSILVLGHLVFLVGLLGIVLEVPFVCLRYDKADLWCAYGIFSFFAALALLIFCLAYYFYEAVRGDEVFVHRFWRRKSFQVGDIRRIQNIAGMSVVFYGENDRRLFSVDTCMKGIGDVIALINERKPSEPPAEETESESVRESRELLRKMGREYRASYEERRKKLIRRYVPIVLALLAAFNVVLCLLSDAFTLIKTLPLSVAYFIVGLWSSLTSLKRELKNDDFWLGNQHKYTNKRIKGASKAKFKAIRIVCILLMVCGVVFSAMFLPFGIGQEPQSYAELTPVTGKMEYWRQTYTQSPYFAIGFYDVPTEYRLSSIWVDELDASFFAEVKKGDEVTLYIDGSKDHAFSMRRVSRKQWNDFYALEVNGKAYFTYDDYLKGYKEDRAVWYGGVIGGAALAVGSAGTLTGAYFVCKSREKDEDIALSL